ncbi:MAG: ammonium transporter [Rhodospirillales bacterium]|nr:ammonium transporter [Rhodospirillales bacterium]
MNRIVTAAASGLALLFALLPGAARAAEIAPSSGNIAWVLTASALVLFMTLPGLALFYGGLVRARNVLSVLMHCFVICCIASLIWAVFGYSLAFDDGGSALLGSLDKAFLAHLAATKGATMLPEGVFALFQMTFAIITPALIVGAFPERVEFRFVVLFSTVWLVIVYLPVAHWVWGGGFLAARGVIDFAGGIVVHTTAGVAALVTALMLGARRGFPNHLTPPHNPTMTMVGGGMLWFGWFGFNGGSALAADATAASAIIATHLSAATAALAWMALEWIRQGKPTSIGIVTGSVAGLATVTPAAGFVGPLGAIVIGLCAGPVCYAATVTMKQRWKIDDTLDVFAVHGVGGMLGSLLVAIFALPALGGTGLADNMDWRQQLAVQAMAVALVALWSGLATFGIVKLIGLATALRVTEEQEDEGLDLASHGERAYDYT